MPTVLIATWNVNSLNARMPRVEEWLAAVRIPFKPRFLTLDPVRARVVPQLWV